MFHWLWLVFVILVCLVFIAGALFLLVLALPERRRR